MVGLLPSVAAVEFLLKIAEHNNDLRKGVLPCETSQRGDSFFLLLASLLNTVCNCVIVCISSFRWTSLFFYYINRGWIPAKQVFSFAVIPWASNRIWTIFSVVLKKINTVT